MNPNFQYNDQITQSLYDERNQNSPPMSHNQFHSNSDKAQGSRRSRVSRACDVCRRKKIRCDVDVHNPCSTCQQNSWECTFNEQSRKRGPPKGYIGNLESRLKKMEKLIESLSGGGAAAAALDLDDDFEIPKRQKFSHSPTESVSSSSTATAEVNALKQEQPPLPRSLKDIPVASKELEEPKIKERLSAIEPKIARYIGSSSGLYLMSNTREEDTLRKGWLFKDEIGSYRFGAASDACDDVMLLRDQVSAERTSGDDDRYEGGAFSRDMLSCLIQSFFSKAHQFMPIVDKDSFIDSFENHRGVPVSKALLYTLTSIGCRLLDSTDPIFKKHNVTKQVLFATLMDKATEAVSRNYLNTKIEIIQSLALLASQPSFAANSYTAWMYSGMAVRMAQDLGLHRSIPKWKMGEAEAEQRKRIWFSVYAVDRWCCAAVGRPLAVCDADCDIEPPHLCMEEYLDSKTKRCRMLFHNMISLSVILGLILRQLYSPKVKSLGHNCTGITTMVARLKAQLADWYESVPEPWKLNDQDIERIRQARTIPLDAELKEKIETAGILTICHQTLVILMHRPFITVKETTNTSPTVQRAASKCSEAAKLITDIAYALSRGSRALCFEWNFPCYSIYQATLIHLFDCANDSEAVAKEARKYVRLSVDECLKPIFETVPHGWRILTFVNNVLAAIPTHEERLAKTKKSKPLDGPGQEPSPPDSSTAASVNTDALQQLFSSFSEGVATPDASGYPTNAYPGTFSHAAGQIPDPNSAAPFWGASSAFGFDWQDWDAIFMPSQVNTNNNDNSSANANHFT